MDETSLKGCTLVEMIPIYETTNYDMFHFIDGNRDIDWKWVDQLAKEISRDGQKNPIRIDPDLGINDGQNRFEACKKLGIPIKWTPDEKKTIFDIQNENAVRRNWKEEDYLKCFLKLGSNPIKRVKGLMDEFDEFKVSRQLVMIAAGKDKNLFSKGHFEKRFAQKTKKDPMVDTSFSEADYQCAKDRLSYAVSIVEIISQYKKVDQPKKLIEVILMLDKINGFDRDRLKAVVEANWLKVATSSPAKSAVIMSIEKIYNYRRKDGRMHVDVTTDGRIKRVWFEWKHATKK